MTELHEILYCSELSSEQPPNVVGRIVAQARARNADDDITGILVFDGQHFCQHIEGPHRAVVALMSRVEQDKRHTDVRVVYDGPLPQRRYQRFDMGFAEVEGSGSIAELHTLDGEGALKRFLALRPSFDVNG